MLFLHLALICQSAAAFLEVAPSREQDIVTPCPPGFFPCNKSEACVEQNKNCDGNSDCPDGSDETECEDYHQIQYFNNLFRKRPDEDRDKRVEECELKRVPSTCRCSSYKLFCERANLHRPPENLPENAEELDLSGNELEILESNFFHQNEDLEILIIRMAKVTLVNKDAFIGLPNLRSLYLTNNLINGMIEGTMATNHKLSFLDLSYNPITVLSPGAFVGLQSLEVLDLRHCLLKSLPSGVFDSLKNLKILFLDNNKIENVTQHVFQKLINLEMLYISWNKLQSIHYSYWIGLHNLKTLAISENKLAILESSSFGNITSLTQLDVNGNQVKSIAPDAFSGLFNLESLNLQNNVLKKATKAAFEPLTSLEYIYFDEFHFCSLALHVRVCEPKGDGISSIAHLLDSVVLRVSVWAVALTAAAANLAVLVGRSLLSETNAVHSFYIKNLSLADLLMSVYLLTIGGHDAAFRGEYIRHEAAWRSSWRCDLAGFLSTLSSEASVLILAVITIDRYMSIIHPLSVKKRTLHSAGGAMACAWGVAILFSGLPLLGIGYFGDEFYGNNGVCLPLQIHDPYSQAWEYSTFLFCFLNLSAFVLIAFAYSRMFMSISNSQVGLRCTQQQQDRNIAHRFFFIVATDFLCWVPIVCIKAIAMAGVRIQSDLYAWVAVFLLPVNSAINPVLYTLTTKLFKQHLSKMVYNFKNSDAHRTHSLRSNRSQSQGEHNHMALLKSRSFSRQASNSSDCKRNSSKRSTTATNVL